MASVTFTCRLPHQPRHVLALEVTSESRRCRQLAALLDANSIEGFLDTTHCPGLGCLACISFAC